MRFFYEKNITQDVMQLSAETAKHVTQVLRLKTGDQFMLTDGQGTKATVEILSTNKRDCVVKILETEIVENENPDVSLAIAFTKNNARMEWLLEKITEIGIRNIYPLQTARSEKNIIKTDRFQKKMVSAMLQSQQYYLPVLHEPINLAELTTLRQTQGDKDFDKKLIAHCEDDITRRKIDSFQLLPVRQAGSTFNSHLIAIGPEGDFTPEEIELALQQNFKSVSLGKNRLRTETAGLVAVTLLHHLCEK